jgi:hypothetical protein
VRKTLSPALVLFFLAPVIPELLTGSTPLANFLNPFGFALLVGLYGSGAVVARELTYRWGKGWPTLLSLGAAYGIIEEGLMVRSFFSPNYIPPPIQYLIAVLTVAGLFWLGKRLPRSMFGRRETRVRSPFIFGLVGALGTVAFFLVFWGLPSTGLSVPVTIAVSMAYLMVVAWIILRMTGNGYSWSDVHELGLVSGALSPFIILAPLRELSKTQPKNLAGITLVALLFAVLLGLIALRIRRRESPVMRAFCTNCGVAVMPEDIYCRECGGKL